MEDIKRFTVTIEKDTDGTYVAYNVNGDGYVISGRGASVEEAPPSPSSSSTSPPSSTTTRPST